MGHFLQGVGAARDSMRGAWQNKYLEWLSGYPGGLYPALAMNKLVAAGGVLPVTALTKFERQRIEARFVTGARQKKKLWTRQSWLDLDGRRQVGIEITAFGWQEMNRWSAWAEAGAVPHEAPR